MARCHLKRKMAHDRSNNDRSLLERKGGANTNAWADAKGKIGKPVDRVARWTEKAVRIETVRHCPQCAVTVKHIRRDDNHCACFDALARKFIGSDGLAAYGR